MVEALEHRTLLSAVPANSTPPTIDVVVSSIVSEDTPFALVATVADADGGVLDELVVNWGDGNEETVARPASTQQLQHAYANPGTYAITARVRGGPDWASRQLKIDVTERPPQPTLAASTRARPGQPYTIRLQSDPLADDPVLFWTINWGDGIVEDVKVGVTAVSHRYERSGRYRVAVSATDRTGSYRASPEGEPRSTALVVAVNNQRPQPTIMAPDAAAPGQGIRFKGKTNDGSSAGYAVAWDFGDRKKFRRVFAPLTQSVLSPSHTYARAGTYTVRMWVRNNAGAVGAAKMKVSVAPLALQERPDRRGEKALVIGGTAGNDVIRFRHRWSGVEAVLNGKSLGVFQIDRVVAYGGKGDDTITVDDLVDLPAELDGGPGNDRLHASSESRILVGGPGLDRLTGGGSELWE